MDEDREVGSRRGDGDIIVRLVGNRACTDDVSSVTASSPPT